MYYYNYMQMLLFLLIVWVLSLPWLPPPHAMIFSFILLTSIILGQMVIGFGIFLIDSVLYKLIGKSISYEIFLKGKIKISVLFTRLVTIILIISIVNTYASYLLLPSFIGIIYWFVIENFGEKKYRLKLP